MAAVAAGAAIVGAGIQTYGQLKAASDQADIDRKKQFFAEQQAEEIGKREMIDDALRQSSAFKSKEDFSSASAASGHSGAGIGSQLEIQRQVDLQNMLADKEAAFEQLTLREGGALQGQLADQTQQAGYWNAAGTLFSSAGQIGSNPAFTNNTKTDPLPPRTRGY